MTIGEIITKHFMEFSGMVRNQDRVIEDSRTSEDLFSDAMLTAMKKYKDKDVDETEAYDYIRKTLLTEWFFAPKRKKRDILVFTDAPVNIPVYPEE